MIDIPPSLWMPPKPAIIRAASTEDLRLIRERRHQHRAMLFPVFCPIADTSYSNLGGTGNRSALIAVTASSAYTSSQAGSAQNLVNGNMTADSTNAWATVAAAVSGNFIRFDFGSGASKIINEAKWYQNNSGAAGTHKWQGSNDAANWTDIGNAFTLGGATTQTHTELAGNSAHYRYYQLLGASGNLSATIWYVEIEFKIAD